MEFKMAVKIIASFWLIIFLKSPMDFKTYCQEFKNKKDHRR